MNTILLTNLLDVVGSSASGASRSPTVIVATPSLIACRLLIPLPAGVLPGRVPALLAAATLAFAVGGIALAVSRAVG